MFFSKNEYTPLVKYILLYTTFSPLLGSPSLNYPIILSYYIYPMLIVQNLTTIRQLTFGRHLIFILHIHTYLYICFLVIHPLSIHFSMYLVSFTPLFQLMGGGTTIWVLHTAIVYPLQFLQPSM